MNHLLNTQSLFRVATADLESPEFPVQINICTETRFCKDELHLEAFSKN